MTRSAKPKQSTAAIFAWPIAIFLLGLVGLVVALTGDGWRDAASWLALAAPVLATGWAMHTRRS